jgi:protein-arginine kinase activator protein McsA
MLIPGWHYKIDWFMLTGICHWFWRCQNCNKIYKNVNNTTRMCSNCAWESKNQECIDYYGTSNFPVH